MNLVYLDGQKEPYTTHEIVAEHAEIDSISVRKLIDKHRKRLEAFGVLSFEIHKPEKGSLGGRPRKIYHLNEQQATLLVTYLGNSLPVVEFKTNLVRAFFEMRDELAKFRLQRQLEAPKRKALHSAIAKWEHAPKHAHSTMVNLLLKGTTGLNKKQLIEARGGTTGIDTLTSEELVRYQALEDMAIAMITLNMNYHDTKYMVFRTEEVA
ncbi:Rha family transcriptional regulator [Streptococcus danieliae]|uniref:Rha family transcriptional regulator n=1 Tax=Streptococcus danieliae TaxID=747656 RepID=A0A7Z0RQC7_9STRE|nr:Rha family transcriptional regulator [Streptococcus danieliae]MBF0716602.1 Rha family transcriptional regulator [Streptococcus danieliae]NYS48532.1 Rha family transcriptional regulator [Streptococcus danieliae]